eukprot:gnl/Chilomastix_cuspidata/7165.p1 GENE.gnl/Chilomastix_cuspidata/7165~~gnl/Chilomastix_cuspidata/7165.p1  ORF type:complete len:248 (-),score=42.77 gnl/Chilomastix_cuspidata/7165:30-773(-)
MHQENTVCVHYGSQGGDLTVTRVSYASTVGCCHSVSMTEQLVSLPQIGCAEVAQYVAGVKAVEVKDPFGFTFPLNADPLAYAAPPRTFRPFGAIDPGIALARLRAMGFNTVKLLVCLEALAPEGPRQLCTEYVESIADLCRLCWERNLGVIIGFEQRGFSRRLGGYGFPDWMLPPPLCAAAQAGSLASASRKALARHGALLVAALGEMLEVHTQQPADQTEDPEPAGSSADDPVATADPAPAPAPGE